MIIIDDSEVVGSYEELLIIELKKGGGSTIGGIDKYQTLNYANEIRKHGHIDNKTKINTYVLGSKIDSFEINTFIDGNIKIIPKQYDLIIKIAKNRTFNLINKIKNVKGLTDIGDDEINEILKEDTLQ